VPAHQSFKGGLVTSAEETLEQLPVWKIRAPLAEGRPVEVLEESKQLPVFHRAPPIEPLVLLFLFPEEGIFIHLF
jgi:hypothetical protein